MCLNRWIFKGKNIIAMFIAEKFLREAGFFNCYVYFHYANLIIIRLNIEKIY